MVVPELLANLDPAQTFGAIDAVLDAHHVALLVAGCGAAPVNGRRVAKQATVFAVDELIQAISMHMPDGVHEVAANRRLENTLTGVDALWLVRVFRLAVTVDVVLHWSGFLAQRNCYVHTQLRHWLDALVVVYERPCVLQVPNNRKQSVMRKP